jgi:hypothetical protein
VAVEEGYRSAPIAASLSLSRNRPAWFSLTPRGHQMQRTFTAHALEAPRTVVPSIDTSFPAVDVEGVRGLRVEAPRFL